MNIELFGGVLLGLILLTVAFFIYKNKSKKNLKSRITRTLTKDKDIISLVREEIIGNTVIGTLFYEGLEFHTIENKDTLLTSGVFTGMLNDKDGLYIPFSKGYVFIKHGKNVNNLKKDILVGVRDSKTTLGNSKSSLKILENAIKNNGGNFTIKIYDIE